MADYRSLEIKVKYARHLKKVNLLSKMDPYVVVSISSDPKTKHKTPIHRTGNKNPSWDSSVKFSVDVAAARRVRPTLVFSILCHRALRDKPIGDVHVPLADLLTTLEDSRPCHVAYQVRKPSGRAKGELNFSYRWAQDLAGSQPPATAPPFPELGKVEEPVAANPPVAGMSSGFYPPGSEPHGGYGHLYPPAVGKVEETVTAYPVVTGTSSGFYPSVPEPGPYQPAPHGGYEYQYSPVVGYSNHPTQSYVGYPPSYQYSGYPPPSGSEYGYQAQPSYGHTPVHPAPRNKNSNNLLGIGTGLLGGLLVGDLLFG